MRRKRAATAAYCIQPSELRAGRERTQKRRQHVRRQKIG